MRTPAKTNIGGRPTLCTPERIKRLCECVALGMKWQDAAGAIGVDQLTVRRWRRKGKENPDSIYGVLVKELVRAEALLEEGKLRVLHEAATQPQITRTEATKRDKDTGEMYTEVTVKEGPPQWTPAAWLLERRFPNKYALMTRVETGAPGAFDNLDEEELKDKILSLLRNAEGVFVPDEANGE